MDTIQLVTEEKTVNGYIQKIISEAGQTNITISQAVIDAYTNTAASSSSSTSTIESPKAYEPMVFKS